METKKIVIYDFDGTLTPYSLPKWKILEKSGLKDGALDPIFMKRAKEKVKEKNIDLYLAIYETYFEIIKEAGFQLVDDNFCLGYDKVEYNSGVFEFLSNLCSHNISNYLLSSGIKVFLDKVEIAKFFSKIYATTFNYDENGEAISICHLMSDKNKVNAIKEIIKDNGYKSDDCFNVIYIGDGLTDFYAMEYVKKNNGTTIFVYYDEDSTDLAAIKEKNVVSFYTLADFSLNGELNSYIKKVCNIKHN